MMEPRTSADDFRPKPSAGKSLYLPTGAPLFGDQDGKKVV